MLPLRYKGVILAPSFQLAANSSANVSQLANIRRLGKQLAKQL